MAITEDKDQFNTELDRLSLIKKVFDNEDGRKMIAVLFGTCGVIAPSADLTPQKLAYMEGRRSVALELAQAIHQDPTEYLKLLQEAYAEQDQM